MRDIEASGKTSFVSSLNTSARPSTTRTRGAAPWVFGEAKKVRLRARPHKERANPLFTYAAAAFAVRPGTRITIFRSHWQMG
jgi:hypothetical protein